jgi:hypothetical protein
VHFFIDNLHFDGQPMRTAKKRQPIGTVTVYRPYLLTHETSRVGKNAHVGVIPA